MSASAQEINVDPGLWAEYRTDASTSRNISHAATSAAQSMPAPTEDDGIQSPSSLSSVRPDLLSSFTVSPAVNEEDDRHPAAESSAAAPLQRPFSHIDTLSSFPASSGSNTPPLPASSLAKGKQRARSSIGVQRVGAGGPSTQVGGTAERPTPFTLFGTLEELERLRLENRLLKRQAQVLARKAFKPIKGDRSQSAGAEGKRAPQPGRRQKGTYSEADKRQLELQLHQSESQRRRLEKELHSLRSFLLSSVEPVLPDGRALAGRGNNADELSVAADPDEPRGADQAGEEDEAELQNNPENSGTAAGNTSNEGPDRNSHIKDAMARVGHEAVPELESIHAGSDRGDGHQEPNTLAGSPAPSPSPSPKRYTESLKRKRPSPPPFAIQAQSSLAPTKRRRTIQGKDSMPVRIALRKKRRITMGDAETEHLLLASRRITRLAKALKLRGPMSRDLPGPQDEPLHLSADAQAGQAHPTSFARPGSGSHTELPDREDEPARFDNAIFDSPEAATNHSVARPTGSTLLGSPIRTRETDEFVQPKAHPHQQTLHQTLTSPDLPLSHAERRQSATKEVQQAMWPSPGLQSTPVQPSYSSTSGSYIHQRLPSGSITRTPRPSYASPDQQTPLPNASGSASPPRSVSASTPASPKKIGRPRGSPNKTKTVSINETAATRRRIKAQAYADTHGGRGRGRGRPRNASDGEGIMEDWTGEDAGFDMQMEESGYQGTENQLRTSPFSADPQAGSAVSTIGTMDALGGQVSLHEARTVFGVPAAVVGPSTPSLVRDRTPSRTLSSPKAAGSPAREGLGELLNAAQTVGEEYEYEIEEDDDGEEDEDEEEEEEYIDEDELANWPAQHHHRNDNSASPRRRNYSQSPRRRPHTQMQSHQYQQQQQRQQQQPPIPLRTIRASSTAPTEILTSDPAQPPSTPPGPRGPSSSRRQNGSKNAPVVTPDSATRQQTALDVLADQAASASKDPSARPAVLKDQQQKQPVQQPLFARMSEPKQQQQQQQQQQHLQPLQQQQHPQQQLRRQSVSSKPSGGHDMDIIYQQQQQQQQQRQSSNQPYQMPFLPSVLHRPPESNAKLADAFEYQRDGREGNTHSRQPSSSVQVGALSPGVSPTYSIYKDYTGPTPNSTSMQSNPSVQTSSANLSLTSNQPAAGPAAQSLLLPPAAVDLPQLTIAQQLQAGVDSSHPLIDRDDLIGGMTPAAALAKKSRSPYVKWSSEEDEKLIQGVAEHGTKWDSVAKYLPTRSYHQCRQRWLRGLKSGEALPDNLKHYKPQLDAGIERYEQARANKNKSTGNGKGGVSPEKQIAEDDDEE